MICIYIYKYNYIHISHQIECMFDGRAISRDGGTVGRADDGGPEKIRSFRDFRNRNIPQRLLFLHFVLQRFGQSQNESTKKIKTKDDQTIKTHPGQKVKEWITHGRSY